MEIIIITCDYLLKLSEIRTKSSLEKLGLFFHSLWAMERLVARNFKNEKAVVA